MLDDGAAFMATAEDLRDHGTQFTLICLWLPRYLSTAVVSGFAAGTRLIRSLLRTWPSSAVAPPITS
ncbi:MAG: hypothetical protein KDB68_17220, partial [Planctomycetes bacterium]|nr:hypothetical protein [Planctomycetota bacterium]